uniref:WWE domain-containing protein n=1 Tax=Esox lucius TaxID=8010 RepID=A0AAY5K4M8_ESOLU
MLLASAVVVWEWLNEHGRWRPYSPAVSHHIEAVIRNDPRGGSVVLGQVDARLSPYIIDLHSMHQFRQDTGKTNVTDNHDICFEGMYIDPVPLRCHYLSETDDVA